MSQEIRKYLTDKRWFKRQSDVEINAVVGGEHGRCIQFTTKNDFFVLSEKQLQDLVKVIRKRLSGDVGYTATDGQSDNIKIYPDGESEG